MFKSGHKVKYISNSSTNFGIVTAKIYTICEVDTHHYGLKELSPSTRIPKDNFVEISKLERLLYV